jgi:hypothetical protein
MICNMQNVRVADFIADHPTMITISSMENDKIFADRCRPASVG